ncbi:zf-HC2 domain-containing protein [Corallococcus sp. bb12-1]|uniref:anti-sigma factor family protein n=1 Tax=Corallococcus sp. bb12-1 TaxID=2996784 RepID=UPI00226E4655|nr:zf-HC2 domain-containing protein [Corallococcus sp. bb12-1]MCY1040188.1 zf-HC2 domain-containing protein [Corallococcus sp. bb12-1]
MAGNPACERFVPLLSPYIDGELAPSERVHVERHLAACRDCTGRSADLRAESGLLRVGLDMAVDDVDFKDFAQKVMARVTPEKPPLIERMRLALSEMFLYQRTAMLSSMATAAVVMLVALPLLLRDGAPEGYAAERMTVKSIQSYQGARVAPVVMETEGGASIIWMVDEQEQAPEPVKSAPAGVSGQPKKLDEAASEELGGELDGQGTQQPAVPAVPPRPTGGAL